MLKVLWIVNTKLGIISEKLLGQKSNGLWMDALLEDFSSHCDEVKLSVVTTSNVNQVIREVENGITFFVLPNNPPILYDENEKSNIKYWEELLKQETPDIIQVWGTEFTHGLCALRVAKQLSIPSVIYMQGYLGSIARHYLAGMTHKELKKSVTFRDVIKRDSIVQQQKKYFVRTKKEKEMLELSGNIISENEWCDKSISAIVPDIKSHHCPLSINKAFSSVDWDINNAEKHSIMCTASGYPLKGLHMMLRAIKILKEKYPDVKLYVPGTKVVSDGSIKWLIRKRGYTKYIEKLIRELDVANNVVWLGNLSQEELAKSYLKARVFVLTSSIENHSSSLKEGMIVGLPCIATRVGGVPEYITHGENGFLYRFEEYEVMAKYVEDLFESDELATKLSVNGKKDMLKLHMNNDMYNTIMNCYESIIGRKN